MKHSSQAVPLSALSPKYQEQAARQLSPSAYPAAEPPPMADTVFEVTPTRDEAKLNKTELAFLYWLRASETHREITIQSLTFKLGDDCRYTPDFTAIRDRRLYIYEIKGHWRDDARVKIKTAARIYRWCTFIAAQKRKGGGWNFELINP
jgi:hypothetical protein